MSDMPTTDKPTPSEDEPEKYEPTEEERAMLKALGVDEDEAVARLAAAQEAGLGPFTRKMAKHRVDTMKQQFAETIKDMETVSQYIDAGAYPAAIEIIETNIGILTSQKAMAERIMLESFGALLTKLVQTAGPSTMPFPPRTEPGDDDAPRSKEGDGYL